MGTINDPNTKYHKAPSIGVKNHKYPKKVNTPKDLDKAKIPNAPKKLKNARIPIILS